MSYTDPYFHLDTSFLPGFIVALVAAVLGVVIFILCRVFRTDGALNTIVRKVWLFLGFILFIPGAAVVLSMTAITQIPSELDLTANVGKKYDVLSSYFPRGRPGTEARIQVKLKDGSDVTYAFREDRNTHEPFLSRSSITNVHAPDPETFIRR